MKAQKRFALVLTLAAASLSGCYIVPVGPDGQPSLYFPIGAPSAPAGLPGAVAPSQRALPQVLHARLYPSNDLATETGMVSGTVTNLGTGKGRFQLKYQGELLTGEATRVSGDERKGVASAYGPTGAFMSCEYQMNTPQQGAGKCNFSNGALYQVHIGN